LFLSSKFYNHKISFTSFTSLKDKPTFSLFLGNHDETPFWRDEMPFWDDETGFFDFLRWENLAIFGLFWDDFGEKHGGTENMERHGVYFPHSTFYIGNFTLEIST